MCVNGIDGVDETEIKTEKIITKSYKEDRIKYVRMNVYKIQVDSGYSIIINCENYELNHKDYSFCFINTIIIFTDNVDDYDSYNSIVFDI